MTRSDVLTTAERLVNGDRDQAHGQPAHTFGVIADFWTVYLSTKLGVDFVLYPHDVAAMMILMKTGRIVANHRHIDSWVDVAGYAACGAEVAES